MNLDMSKFKKLAEDKKSATFQHPDGHKITVAKHVLSAGMRGQLSKIPLHLDEGGDVPDTKDVPVTESQEETAKDLPNVSIDPSLASEPPPPAPSAVDTPAPTSEEIPTSMPQDSHGASGSWETSDKQLPNPMSPNVPDAQAPASDPYGSNAYFGAYQKGLGEQKAGIQGQAQAEGNLGKAQAPILDQAVQQQQQMMKSYQDHFQDLDQERQSFVSDIQNQHIDPQHYLNSMGTGQKISTGIGLILGGFAGINGQANPVMGFINQQIDRDIDAQKAELGKNENLLSANMRQFGNLRDATDMTRLMQVDIVKNQLAEAAAKTQDSMAKARAQQAIGQLDMQAAPIMSQLAMRKTLSQQATPQGQGGAPQMDPASKIRLMGMSGIINPEQQTAATKELSNAEAINNIKKDYLGAFDDIHNQFLNGALSPVDVQSAKQAFIGKIIKETEGRYNYEAAQNLADALYPTKTGSIGDAFGGNTSMKQRQRGVDLLNSLAQKPTLDGLNIQVPTKGKYDQYGKLKSEFKLGAPQVNKGNQ